jgi:hypothetical protein
MDYAALRRKAQELCRQSQQIRKLSAESIRQARDAMEKSHKLREKSESVAALQPNPHHVTSGTGISIIYKQL